MPALYSALRKLVLWFACTHLVMALVLATGVSVRTTYDLIGFVMTVWPFWLAFYFVWLVIDLRTYERRLMLAVDVMIRQEVDRQVEQARRNFILEGLLTTQRDSVRESRCITDMPKLVAKRDRLATAHDVRVFDPTLN